MERVLNAGSLADEWICELYDMDLAITNWQDGDKTFNYLGIGVYFPYEKGGTYVIHLYDLHHCELDDKISYKLEKILTSGYDIGAFLKDRRINKWTRDKIDSSHAGFLKAFSTHAMLKYADENDLLTFDDAVYMVNNLTNQEEIHDNLPDITYLNHDDELFYKILNNSYVM